MYNFPIVIMMDSFRLPDPETITKAVAMRAKGLSMCTTETCYRLGHHADKDERKDALK